jgi:Response regulators consisting of a CheY-like receiver domain and a winged-helix DNA-binding domain
VDYPISCDLLSKKIFCGDMVVELTNSEYEICELLLKNRNSVFSKEKIYTTIYGYDAEGDSSTTITERVKLIRSKFGKYNIDPIKTIWGVGYQWEIKEV